MSLPDLVDEFFSDPDSDPIHMDVPKPEPDDEYYPGSKRKKAEKPAAVEFIPDPWRENFTIKVINGAETPMYPIGAFATALGVSVQSIRHWTRMGWIPTAPYRLPSNMVVKGEKVSGRRLYTEAMIESVMEAFEKRGLLGKPRIEWSKHTDLSIEIKETWSRLVQQSNRSTTTRSN